MVQPPPRHFSLVYYVLPWWNILEDTATPAPIRTSEIPSVQKTPSASHFETGRWGGSHSRAARKLLFLPILGGFWAILA